MASPKILAFAGSLRKDSFNKKLVKVAAEGARSAGAEVTVVDLKEFPMPVYDGDIETAEGLPVSAKKLKELFLAHQGLLLACPEYNSSITGALKNTIDWVSRPASDDEPSLACFKRKTAVIMSGARRIAQSGACPRDPVKYRRACASWPARRGKSARGI